MRSSKDNETCEREASLWLKKKEIPYQRYKNLPTHLKVVLRKLICIPPSTTTPRQRKELYTKLCLPHVGGRDSPNPVDFMPDGELEKFFAPLAPSETLSYFEKF